MLLQLPDSTVPTNPRSRSFPVDGADDENCEAGICNPSPAEDPPGAMAITCQVGKYTEDWLDVVCDSVAAFQAKQLREFVVSRPGDSDAICVRGYRACSSASPRTDVWTVALADAKNRLARTARYPRSSTRAT
ncbi:hypothetical protein Dda_6702 [Drechslerella dactyloides]|uniref:Uncharacterized protein n=1 Tax=Drechslerella dactyloides TaxID=74499 RepID=A0AAD6NHM6_DREDA|nr:hypothetical protein Dda_6702 [Drechslerella dactyloides]